MKFWPCLRWVSTAAFVILVLWSVWTGDDSAAPAHQPNPATRPFNL